MRLSALHHLVSLSSYELAGHFVVCCVSGLVASQQSRSLGDFLVTSLKSLTWRFTYKQLLFSTGPVFALGVLVLSRAQEKWLKVTV